MKERIIQYQQRIDNYNLQRSKFRQFQKYFPVSRFITFILSCVFIYYCVKYHSYLNACIAIISFIVFFVLGHLDIKYKLIIQNLELLIKINQNEIDVINGNFSKNNSGDEFIDFDHPFTFDLDIFGKNSLFQYIDRTSTIYGKYRLAEFFKNAYNYKNDIYKRQEAILELSENIEFRQQIQLIFSKNITKESDLSEMRKWLESSNTTEQKLRSSKNILYLVNLLTISSIILSACGIISIHFVWTIILAQLLFAGRISRRLLKIQEISASKFRILDKYSQCLALLEKVTFKSELLVELKNSFSKQEKKPPSKVINKLSGIINFMDSNLNLIVAVILNGCFSINVHLLFALESWKLKYKQYIPEWFDTIGKFDALSSLGNFAYNNPDYIYPEISHEEFSFIAKQIGHPLIARNACIKNDIEIKGWKQISIITGANMSGKSTMLRTIGTNLILAMIGAPVCSDKFIFTPIEIHTSMRTNDSLAKSESYFYAELKRLKEIIDELEKGKKKLILLDEILKGTNSNDKRAGSMALVHQLLNYKIIAMVATHDQVLGELIDESPKNITNLCFEISIVNDKMEIDYKIKPGICQNLNATFLMKNMGIIFPVTA